MRAPHRALVVGFVVLGGLAGLPTGCGREEPERPAPDESPAPPSAAEESRWPDDPPRAQRETVEAFRALKRAPRHPSDGGGRAWLEEGPGEDGSVEVGGIGTWTFRYRTGAGGVAVGGSVRLLISPFWGWTPPQVHVPDGPGYTTVTTEAQGISLEPAVLDGGGGPGWLVVTIAGRALAEGDELCIVYGEGETGARADRYAERDSRFWFAVDGDGDGFYQILADSPGVTVRPGPARRLLLTLPSIARPDQPARLTLALVDRVGNAGVDFAGRIQLAAVPDTLEHPAFVELEPEDRGHKTIEVVPREPGTYVLVAQVGVDGGDVLGQSNPMLVETGSPRILWGDLHGHTNLTDGTGTVEDYFLYARDVAALDVLSLTDHDHWGLLFLDEQPELWKEIEDATARFDDPGRFVTLLGYEWTNWIHGHRHVIWFDTDRAHMLSSIDPEYETPTQLWDALRGQKVLTYAHHSAGGPIATNWDFPPDPELEPVTEIVSVHGSSEAPDAPNRIYDPLAGNSVRDVLDRGYRLGFVGSGDSHDGHPGRAHLASPTGGGLAAILSDDLSREGVYEAMRARRVYATNGPRIILRCALDSHRMGSTVPAPAEGESASLYVRAICEQPIRYVDVVRSGQVQRLDLSAEEVAGHAQVIELEGLKSGEYVYVRVIQVDRGAAWTSPFYVD